MNKYLKIVVLVTLGGIGSKPLYAQRAITPGVIPDATKVLLTKYNCLSCHHPSKRLVGPSYLSVAKRNYEDDEIIELIRRPKPEHWPGFSAMPAVTTIKAKEALTIANWINSLNKSHNESIKK